MVCRKWAEVYLCNINFILAAEIWLRINPMGDPGHYLRLRIIPMGDLGHYYVGSALHSLTSFCLERSINPLLMARVVGRFSGLS